MREHFVATDRLSTTTLRRCSVVVTSLDYTLRQTMESESRYADPDSRYIGVKLGMRWSRPAHLNFKSIASPIIATIARHPRH